MKKTRYPFKRPICTAIPPWNTTGARSPTTHFLAPAPWSAAADWWSYDAPPGKCSQSTRCDPAIRHRPIFITKGVYSQMLHGIFTYIWLIYGVNVGKYSIHGAYRICWWLDVNLILGRKTKTWREVRYVGLVPEWLGSANRSFLLVICSYLFICFPLILFVYACFCWWCLRFAVGICGGRRCKCWWFLVMFPLCSGTKTETHQQNTLKSSIETHQNPIHFGSQTCMGNPRTKWSNRNILELSLHCPASHGAH